MTTAAKSTRKKRTPSKKAPSKSTPAKKAAPPKTFAEKLDELIGAVENMPADTDRARHLKGRVVLRLRQALNEYKAFTNSKE